MLAIVALLIVISVGLALALGGAWSDETRMERNDLVFAGRNRSYGAYPLRTGYGQRMGTAYLGAFGLLSALVVIPSLLKQDLPSELPTANQVPQVIAEFTDFVLPPAAAKAIATAPVAKPTPVKPNPAEERFVEAVDTAAPPLLSADSSIMAVSSGSTTGSGTGPIGPSNGTGSATGMGSTLAVDSVWKDFQVQEVPLFPGGEAALRTWVERNLDFPRDFEGRDAVYVQFTVGLDGAVEDVRAVKGNRAACRAAAERTVRMMPRWKPARMNGNNVRCRLTLPIHFEVR